MNGNNILVKITEGRVITVAVGATNNAGGHIKVTGRQ